MDEPLTLSFTGRVEEGALAGAGFYGALRLDPAAAPARIDPATGEALYAVEDPDAVFTLDGAPLEPVSVEIGVGNNFVVSFPGNPISLPFDILRVTLEAADGTALTAGIASADTATLAGRSIPEAPAGFVARGLRFDLFDLRDFDSTFASELRLDGAAAAAETTRLAISAGAVGAGLAPEEARAVARLYEAALDRDGRIDAGGLNFWIDAREGGLSERDLAAAFLASPEFEAAFGPVEERPLAELVPALYENALDREADPGGLAFWQGVAARPGASAEGLLIEFAASAENVAGTPEVGELVEVAPGVWDFL
jgi:hypothetical protein